MLDRPMTVVFVLPGTMKVSVPIQVAVVHGSWFTMSVMKHVLKRSGVRNSLSRVKDVNFLMYFSGKSDQRVVRLRPQGQPLAVGSSRGSQRGGSDALFSCF
jgi:hypothetical protein